MKKQMNEYNIQKYKVKTLKKKIKQLHAEEDFNKKIRKNWLKFYVFICLTLIIIRNIILATSGMENIYSLENIFANTCNPFWFGILGVCTNNWLLRKTYQVYTKPIEMLEKDLREEKEKLLFLKKKYQIKKQKDKKNALEKKVRKSITSEIIEQKCLYQDVCQNEKKYLKYLKASMLQEKLSRYYSGLEITKIQLLLEQEQNELRLAELSGTPVRTKMKNTTSEFLDYMKLNDEE